MCNVKRIGDHCFSPPALASFGAAGYDLRITHGMILFPGQRRCLGTGFAWEIPLGMVGLVRPRSGLAVRDGLDVLAGVIDSDYRGEVAVVLINHGDRAVALTAGDRIAQMLIVQHYDQPLREVDELLDSARGGDGFGSTGQ